MSPGRAEPQRPSASVAVNAQIGPPPPSESMKAQVSDLGFRCCRGVLPGSGERTHHVKLDHLLLTGDPSEDHRPWTARNGSRGEPGQRSSRFRQGSEGWNDAQCRGRRRQYPRVSARNTVTAASLAMSSPGRPRSACLAWPPPVPPAATSRVGRPVARTRDPRGRGHPWGPYRRSRPHHVNLSESVGNAAVR